LFILYTAAVSRMTLIRGGIVKDTRVKFSRI